MRKAYRSHGLEEPENDAPEANHRNVIAWRAFNLVTPDCRVMGFNGAGFLDWSQVVVVLRDFYGFQITPDLHWRLRVCIVELLKIEAEKREQKKCLNQK